MNVHVICLINDYLSPARVGTLAKLTNVTWIQVSDECIILVFLHSVIDANNSLAIQPIQCGCFKKGVSLGCLVT